MSNADPAGAAGPGAVVAGKRTAGASAVAVPDNPGTDVD